MSIECRICYTAESEAGPLLRPCSCRGSIAHVHHFCLQKWIESSGQVTCPICQDSYSGSNRLKPLAEWQWPLLQLLSFSIIFLPSILVIIVTLLSCKLSFEDKLELLLCLGVLVAALCLSSGYAFWRTNRMFVVEDREVSVDDV